MLDVLAHSYVYSRRAYVSPDSDQISPDNAACLPEIPHHQIHPTTEYAFAAASVLLDHAVHEYQLNTAQRHAELPD